VPGSGAACCNVLLRIDVFENGTLSLLDAYTFLLSEEKRSTQPFFLVGDRSLAAACSIDLQFS